MSSIGRNLKVWFAAVGVTVLGVGFIATSLAIIGQRSPAVRAPYVAASDGPGMELYMPSLSRVAAGEAPRVE